MLKIYKVSNLYGNIKLEDHIQFENGICQYGLYGFGQISSNNPSINIANYELLNLKAFLDNLEKLERKENFVENFTLMNPQNYETVFETYKDVPKTMEDYDRFGLNEEAVLLFTNWVEIKYKNEELVKKLLGKKEVALYLLKPNAEIIMKPALFDTPEEDYELLQSNNVGKRLVLQKMNRKI